MIENDGTRCGRLIVISGPSGAGKSTVVSRVLEACNLPLELSVSATTREPRKGEVDGVNYWFLTQEEFHRRRENNEFLECVEVFGHGDWYGTLKEQVTTGLNEGKWLILEIDIEGAMKVVSQYPQAITIFVHPGSLEELEQRLRNRRTESEESIRHRLAVAQEELDSSSSYQHVVINREVDETVNQICSLLQASGEENACSTN